jgi:PAS domain S-box-containing protein
MGISGFFCGAIGSSLLFTVFERSHQTTLLKQAQTALQQSEARFQLVAETATCAFLVYRGNHLRYVNPAAEQITGYSRDELLTMNFWELAHPDYQGLVRDRGLARQRGEKVPRRYEIKIITKLGQERWIDIIGSSAHIDGHPAALATAYDITDLKQAEAQLQVTANRDRLLSEIALRIRSSLSLEEILSTTVAEVRQFLKADRVFIAHLEAGESCQTIAESVDMKWKSTLGWLVNDQAVAEIRQRFEPGRVNVVNNADEIEKTPFLDEYYSRCQVKACLGMPIILDGDLFGVLAVNQCSTPRQWQPFEIELLQQLGTQVEISSLKHLPPISNAKLRNAPWNSTNGWQICKI